MLRARMIKKAAWTEVSCILRGIPGRENCWRPLVPLSQIIFPMGASWMEALALLVAETGSNDSPATVGIFSRWL
jgi:hypothetical protein